MPTLDQEFNYAGYHGIASKCRLRVWIYGRIEQSAVVMLTEYPTGGGTSITNRGEHIATKVVSDILKPLGIGHSRVTWIENYPEFDNSFDSVTYEWEEVRDRYTTRWQARRPSWQRRSEKWVEELVKEPV